MHLPVPEAREMKSDSVKGRPSWLLEFSRESQRGSTFTDSRRAGLASPHALGLSRRCPRLPQPAVKVPWEGRLSVGLKEAPGRPREVWRSGSCVPPVFTLRMPCCSPSLIPGPNVPWRKAVADGLVPRSLQPSPQACFFLCLLRTQHRCQIVLSSAQAVPCLVQYQGAAHWAVERPQHSLDEASAFPVLTSVGWGMSFPLLWTDRLPALLGMEGGP